MPSTTAVVRIPGPSASAPSTPRGTRSARAGARPSTPTPSRTVHAVRAAAPAAARAAAAAGTTTANLPGPAAYVGRHDAHPAARALQADPEWAHMVTTLTDAVAGAVRTRLDLEMAAGALPPPAEMSWAFAMVHSPGAEGSGGAAREGADDRVEQE